MFDISITWLLSLVSFYSCFPQAAPWDAAITDKIQGMNFRLAAVDQLEARAVVAEHELRKVEDQNEVLVGQKEALSADKKKLSEDPGTACQKIAKRNGQLKLARKYSHCKA